MDDKKHSEDTTPEKRKKNGEGKEECSPTKKKSKALKIPLPPLIVVPRLPSISSSDEDSNDDDIITSRKKSDTYEIKDDNDNICCGKSKKQIDLIETAGCSILDMNTLPSTFSTPKSSRRNKDKISPGKVSCSTEKRSTSKRNKYEDEYDPENDVFIQGQVPAHYDFKSMKKQIKKFLSSSDLPVFSTPPKRCDKGTTNLNKSWSGSRTISCKEKKVKKRVRNRKKSPSPVPHTLTSSRSLENLVESESTESRVQALLAARETLRQIAKRTNNFRFLQNSSSDPQPSTSASATVVSGDSPDTDVDLPPTQPFSSLVLKDVIAYVEVICDDEDRSLGARRALLDLGATVVDTFTKKSPVTHIIFHHGHFATFKKAKAWNIPMVSFLWIEECRKAGRRLSERMFPPINIQEYEESPVELKKKLKKRKIIACGDTSAKRRYKRKNKTTENVPEAVVAPIVVKPFLPNEPQWVKKAVGDDGRMRILVDMTGIKEQEFNDLVNNVSEVPDDIEVQTPLALRLLRKCIADKQNRAAATPDSQQPGTSGLQNSTVTSEEQALASTSSGNETVTSVKKSKLVKRKLYTGNDEQVDCEDTNGIMNSIENPHASQLESRKGRNSTTSKMAKKSKQNLQNQRTSRRSSVDFVKLRQKSSSSESQLPGIVCTLLHPGDMDAIGKIIKKLGKFVLETSVSAKTTHVIAGEPKRTMKIMKGMLRGCWIVSSRWIYSSLEEDKWLDEEEFELKTDFLAAPKYRLEKLSFGPQFKPDIFRSCGPILISSKCEAPKPHVVELINLGGGEIVHKVSQAVVVVGKQCPGITSVKVSWVFDSISSYSRQNYEKYKY